MNLIELVNYFRKNGDIENFYQSHNLNSEAEVIEIYMSKPFSPKSEVSFFEIEQTEGSIEYKSHGIIYSNLFDIYFFKDFIEDSKKNKNSKLTDENLAEILLNYAINDA